MPTGDLKPGSMTERVYSAGRPGQEKRRVVDQDMLTILAVLQSTRRVALAGLALAAAITPVAGALAWFLHTSGYMPVTQREFQEARAEQTALDNEQSRLLTRLLEQGNLARWSMLNMRRQINGGLSPEDLFEYCALSAILKLAGIGCA